MIKRRIRFSKTGMAKYISHLDLLRCYTRAVMRSSLPVEYSQGFNPHQRMTFALPLPVGVTSECEFVDISFADDNIGDAEIMEKLNMNLPPDIRVLSVGDIVHRAADIVCAEYLIKLNSDTEIEEKRIKQFFAQDEIIVMKKTKKKVEKPINIMDYIRAWEIVGREGASLCLRLVLDAGGDRNLKSDMVVAAICGQNPSMDADFADIHRKRVFCRAGDGLTEEFC